MAEFCLDCWNRINGREDTAREWILSRDLDLCEGCGQWKRVVESQRRQGLFGFFPWGW